MNMQPAPNPDRWMKIESIFHAACEAPLDERRSLVLRMAKGDAELMSEVLSLLKALDRSNEFLESADGLCSEVTQLLSGVQSLWRSSTEPITHRGPNGDQNREPTDATHWDSVPDRAAAASWPLKNSASVAKDFFALHRPELEILEQVGEGSAGIVLKAIDHRLDRLVAIKLLHRDWAKRMGRESLKREAVAASLNSDHVVRVYEISSEDSPIPFVLMEWIGGPSLRHYLGATTALKSREAADLIRQVALGLAAAHHQGVVHGDIKPANIMLESITGEIKEVGKLAYRAKLADFGLARRMSMDAVQEDDSGMEGQSQRPWLASFAGTPAYASPEQLLEGRPANVATDIWSLGATLYHLLSGVPPYAGRPHAILRQIQVGDPLAPRNLDARIPRDLESICTKALSKHPGQRYDSAELMAKDLEHFLQGEPVVARPVSPPVRMVKWIRRHTLVSSLIGVIMIALLSGMLVSNYFRRIAEHHFLVANSNYENAVRERDRAMAVTQLLRGMISSSDTHHGDPNVKVIDALTGLESRLASELKDQPAMEAEMRSNLGSMYFSIAAYQEAFEQFQKAIALRGETLTTESALADRIELANTLRWLYRPEEATAAARQSFEDAARNLGEQHPVTLNGMEVLAGCYKDQGQVPPALELYRKAVRLAPELNLRWRSQIGLAGTLLDNGRYAEAEQELREASDLFQQLGIQDHRESLILNSNLGMALSEQGKLVEAIAIQRETAERAKQKLGPAHDATIAAWLNLAESLRRHGDAEGALQIHRDYLELCQTEFGPIHPKTLASTEAVALCLVRQKRFPEALELLDATLVRVLSEPSVEEDGVLQLKGCRGAALTGLGRADEAIPIFEEVIQRFQEKYGDNSLRVIVHKNNFGLTLLEAHRFDEAEKIYRELIPQVEAAGEASTVRTLKRNLGLALIRRGEFSEAREILQEVRQASQSRGELDNAQKCDEYLEQIPK